MTDEDHDTKNEKKSRVKQSDYVIFKFPDKKKLYQNVCIVQKVT